MRNIEFYKYHGTGNDFILVDGIENELDLSIFTEKKVAHLCDRHLGIGADGLILCLPSEDYDFKMLYFNSDGNQSSMCGNGGRCLVSFAFSKSYCESKTTFIAIDGPHEAVVSEGLISLKMIDVFAYEEIDAQNFFLNTGSPHYVQLISEVDKIDIIKSGHAIRYNTRFQKEGTNVNFVELQEGHISVRTYERGVEDETLSCGTGVVAASLISSTINSKYNSPIEVVTKGGVLLVYFEYSENVYKNIWLKGPAEFVFKGRLSI